MSQWWAARPGDEAVGGKDMWSAEDTGGAMEVGGMYPPWGGWFIWCWGGQGGPGGHRWGDP